MENISKKQNAQEIEDENRKIREYWDHHSKERDSILKEKEELERKQNDIEGEYKMRIKEYDKKMELVFFVIIGYNNAATKKTPPASDGPCYHA